MKKKNNLKKLALLGITGGLVLSAQGVQAEENNSLENGTYLAGGCKSHGCGGGGSIAGCGGGGGGNSGGSCGAGHRPSGDQGYRNAGHGCGGGTEQPNNSQGYNNQGYYNPDQNQTSQSNSQNNSQNNAQGYNNQRQNSKNQIAEGDDTIVNNQKQLNERELESQLNPESKALFQKMTPDEKKFALKVANQSCKGKNDCKGLNSCKTENNSCAGHGSCQGTSAGPFVDKNKAVKVASQKLNDKRKNLNK